MRRARLATILFLSGYLLNGCAGGNGTAPPPVVTHLGLSGPPAGVAGAALSFSVTALDASNALVNSYSATLHFTSSDPHAQLPVSLTLANGSGSFSATLITVGTQTVTATDGTRASIAGTSNPVNITSPVPAITSGSPPDGTTGYLYNGSNGGFTLSASGGTPPYSWSWSAAANSSLPPGLTLANGAISGTPSAAGSFYLVVTVADSAAIPGKQSTTYKITISNPPPPTISISPLPPAGVINAAYPGYTFSAAGLAPLTWNETGSMPPGMSFSADGGLSGTPTASGSFPITVTARDSLSQNSAPRNFTILILAQAVSFTSTGNMHIPRTTHTATLLSDGDVLVVGGMDTNKNVLANAELFNATSHTFLPTSGGLSVPRAHHTATLLCDLGSPTCNNAKVLVTGGTGANSTALAEAELFDPSTGTFMPTGSMTTARTGHTATLLKDGRVLVAGGTDEKGNSLSSAELFDPRTEAFTQTSNVMGASHSDHAATLLVDGRVLIAGGDGGLYAILGDVFDPTTNSFTQTATQGTQANSLTATLLKDGQVLLAGGEVTKVFGAGITCCSYAEVSVAPTGLYDPGNESFSAGADMSTSRALHTATLLLDDRIIIAGGLEITSTQVGVFPVVTTLTPLASAELYDPVAITFAPITNMTTARSGHTATLLSDGSVLFVGGNDANGNVLASAEIFQ